MGFLWLPHREWLDVEINLHVFELNCRCAVFPSLISVDKRLICNW